MENRATRRAKKSAFKKQLKTAIYDDWEDLTIKAVMSKKFPTSFGPLIGFFQNSIYSVQIYQRKEFKLLGIRRHDQKPICPWSHKQRVKNDLVGHSFGAVEVFPKQSELTDAANIYWLWCGQKVDDLIKDLGGIK